MNNVKELTAQLSEVFAQTKAGTMDVKQAESLANIAGKMIKANLGQLSYYELRKESPSLPFWEEPKQ